MTHDIRFKHPSNYMICGPSGSGKTTLTFEILKNKKVLIDKPPKHVLLIYSIHQKIYDDMFAMRVITKMIEGYTSYDELKELVMSYKYDGGSVLIFDDQLSEINDDMMKIFHELSHHGQCSCFFLSQNLFFADRRFRSISLNSHYLFVLKNVRDRSQILHLAKQYSPYKPKFVIESFQEAMRNPFGYLLFDFRQDTSDVIRLRTNILPQEQPAIVFIEENK